MVWRLRGALAAGSEPADANVAVPRCGAGSERPAWLDADAPRDLPDERTISPSSAEEANISIDTAAGGRASERIKAMARGTLMHRLLQALPGVPPERRVEAAQRHLARAATEFSGPERDRMIEQVRMILDDPRFGDLFGAGSRAEVPIVGRVAADRTAASGRTISVSGQMDRLAVTPAAVLIADYKTNRPAPRRLEDVPSGYITQLALYRAVLCRLYPDRPVRAALVWTDVPDLMEISADALDRALAALTSP